MGEYGYLSESYAARHADGMDLGLSVAHPAMVRLCGRVKGLRVLDLGCGTGELAAALAKRGAVVTGVDKEDAMLEHARQHAKAEFVKHDLKRKLPFKEEFDMVTCSLVLDHLKDLKKTVREAYRVLKPGGRFCVAIPNPLFDQEETLAGMRQGKEDIDIYGNYFVARPVRHEYEGNTITTYHRPLQDYIKGFLNAGFTIEAFVEARAGRKAKKNPVGYAFTNRNPYFLLFKLTKT